MNAIYRCTVAYVCGPHLGLPRPVFTRCSLAPHDEGKHRLVLVTEEEITAVVAAIERTADSTISRLLVDPWRDVILQQRRREDALVVGGGTGRPLGIQGGVDEPCVIYGLGGDGGNATVMVGGGSDPRWTA